MKIGIIGAGRVGTSFGKLLYEHNLLSGFYDTIPPSFGYPVFKTKEELCENSDVIFITVPDDKIKVVWDEIKHMCENKTVCHMSGAMSAQDAFPNFEKRVSLHPMMAVSNSDATEELKNAQFSIEGTAVKEIKEAFSFLNIREIDSDKKALYHASCVFASNLMQALVEIGIDNLTKCGFNKDEGIKALEKLTEANIKNIFEKGVFESLTGPVARNDIETVKKHLEVLHGDDKEIYKLLSKKLTYIAESNGDYTQMRKELM